MTEKDLKYFKAWFHDYTKSFYSDDGEYQRNIDIKAEHTANVCRDIITIAERTGLSGEDIRLAETIALFHDVGRFSQYATYRTFRDADSKSHGLLGINCLAEHHVLDRLPREEQEVIRLAVKFHCVFAMPDIDNDRALFFLKLIRDADKLDIYRVFMKYYESPPEDRASATAFGVPDTPECSASMLSCIMEGKIASYSSIRTENDFRLMKLSWIYDLHFDATVRLLNERNYMEKIIGMLPQTEEIALAAARLREHLSKRLDNDGKK